MANPAVQLGGARGGEEANNDHLRRVGEPLLRLLAAGGFTGGEIAAAHLLFELTTAGINRLDQSTRSLEGRREVLGDLHSSRRVLNKLMVFGIDAAQEYLLALEEITELVTSSDEIRRIQDEEMRNDNYDVMAVYLERIEAAVQDVDNSVLYRKSIDLLGGAQGGLAVARLAADCTADKAESAAMSERWWRNAFGACAVGGVGLAAGAIGVAACPPVGVAAVAFGVLAKPTAVAAALIAAYFGYSSHDLAKQNSKTSAELRALFKELDALHDLAIYLECVFVRTSQIIETVRRNANELRLVLSRDWSASRNVVKQVHVRDVIAVFRRRVALCTRIISQTQEDFSRFRERISVPRPDCACAEEGN